MEELHTKYEIAQLISKGVIDELKPEEVQVLEKWRTESDANQNLYERIRKGEQRKARDKYVASINKQAAFNKVMNEIQPKGKVIRLKEWGLRIAAVLVIGALVGVLYNVSTKDIEGGQELAEIKIEPGSAKAVLQLHNGETLQLENVENDSIVEKDGTFISNQSGKLAYATDGNTKAKTLYNQVKVPVGGEYQLVLADGTKVWLNSDSEIKYPVQFNEETRKVWIAGEVYFDVAHNKKKPFVVDVKDVEVEVLGTEFNVEAYHDQNSIVTTLVEGSVKLSKERESIIIKPNQQASISKGEKQFAVRKVESRNYALWKDGIFYFEEASLSTIMERLERWYGIKVFYTNQSVKDKRFSIEVKRYKDIDAVLDILARTNKVEFDVRANVVTVSN